MSGGRKCWGRRNVGIPKVNIHLLERHKHILVNQSSVLLLKFSSTFQQHFNTDM